MPGLGCLAGSADPTMTACRAPTPTNGACSTTAECATLADTCRAAKCQPGGLTGTICTGGDECQMQYTCSITTGQGMCRLLPSVGEPCTIFPICRGGYCDAQNMCAAKIANGGPCDAAGGNARCESNYCDTSLGQCTAPPVCI
jgi:hypothetical protein